MKLASLRLDTACWLSIILETFFYGVYTIIFVAGASIFFNPSTRGRIPLLIAVPSLLLYLNASAHVVTTVVHGANGFIRIASQGQVDGAINYFATTVNGVNMCVLRVVLPYASLTAWLAILVQTTASTS
ncbi:SubName: Full=Uncharacterized protein {ECO:0000313/EMBL:CCA75711.1} [Serendipita indica DSM 11827]|uniref:Uncharacterized protein n=1 Tax=Serendipita indica (strain DSM 11827) TaxID=1109443 RepID=G4TWL8_SERID|nr:SubName: Full=Uncharacterized protein {ECO:0000313/EMBL:CCA75711.1} [Serendipita indica DSM 11827]CCA75711.1 hypothetical protein PIIN_09701 [Serendipita indica DSM 11827]